MLRKAVRLRRTYRHLQRFRDIALVFLKYGYHDVAQRIHLPSLLDLPAVVPNGEAALEPAERFRRACEELGPTFTKLGQALSTRPDLLPPGFGEALTKLQDGASPLGLEELRPVLEAEFGSDLDDIFEHVDPQPLGSASIAQAHKARLKTGESVVVKIQRPGIAQVVAADLDILRQVAGLMEEHLDAVKHHRPSAVVEELADKLQGELDFLREAASMERFASQFEGDETIYVPKVYREATTARVLTLEHIQGRKPAKLAASHSSSADRALVARRISDSVLRQIFVHGFFHADPHPGNIRILPGPVVCFIDYGQMGYLDARERLDFADMLWGIARRDPAHVAQALSRLGTGDPVPSHGLESDAADFMHRHFYRSLKELDFGKMMGQLWEISNRHRLRLPPDFFTMLKAISVTERLLRQLDPEHDIVRRSAPIVRRVRIGRFRPDRVAKEMLDAGLQFGALARDLPAEIRRILSQLRSGEIRIVFRHDNLEPLIHAWDQVSNRVAYSLVLAALIIGSSLMVHADIPPRLGEIPVIGLVGFLCSGVMAFWLLVAIIRHGRM